MNKTVTFCGSFPPPNGLTLRLFLIPVHILRKLGTEVHKVTAATVKTIKTTRN